MDTLLDIWQNDYFKCKQVIMSVENREQLDVAEKYYDLFMEKYASEIYVKDEIIDLFKFKRKALPTLL